MPPIFTPPQIIDGTAYGISDHAYGRFLERFRPMTDSEIVALALKGHPGYIFIWGPREHPPDGYDLVTVIPRAGLRSPKTGVSVPDGGFVVS